VTTKKIGTLTECIKKFISNWKKHEKIYEWKNENGRNTAKGTQEGRKGEWKMSISDPETKIQYPAMA